MSIQILGNGTVAPNLDGQQLQVGKAYTVSAKPGAGQIFLYSETSFGETNHNPKFSFVMRDGLVLRVHFRANPYPELKGVYRGLFFDGRREFNGGILGIIATPADVPGALEISVTANGGFTGRVKLPSATYPIVGKFQWQDENHAVASVSIITSDPLFSYFTRSGIFIGLALNSETNGITAEVVEWTTGVFTSVLKASVSPELCRYMTNKPAPGRYNLLMPPPTNACPGGDCAPGGCSYGTGRVAPSGWVTLSFNLADDVLPITTTSSLAADGNCVFFAQLPRHRGFIMGRLVFTNAPTTDLVAIDSRWRKWAGSSKTYSNGFDVPYELVGSWYLPPKVGTNIAGWTSGVIELANGDLAMSISEQVTFDNRRFAMTGGNPNAIRMVLKGSSGLISGRFVPDGEKMIVFRGLLLPKLEEAGGFFFRTNKTGLFFLGPAPAP